MGKYSNRVKSNTTQQVESIAKIPTVRQEGENKVDFASLPEVAQNSSVPLVEKDESRSSSAVIIGTSIAASVVVAVVLMTALGVTQSLALKLLKNDKFRPTGLLATILERIAKMGSFARWKSKKCGYPVMDGDNLVTWKNALPLYDFLAMHPVLIDDSTGVAHEIQDFDAKDMFEVETDIMSERCYLSDASVDSEKGEIYHFVGPTSSWWLRMPTVTEMYHYVGLSRG